MSDFSFKNFVRFVEIDGEPTDEQINEIFGLFRNNAKLDKLKKEREKLKGMSAAKKAQLDKALQDFKDGKKTPDAEKVRGAIANLDWDDALDSRDRKFLAKRDRLATEAVLTERRFRWKQRPSDKKWIVCDPQGGDLPGYGVFDTEEEAEGKAKKLNESAK